MKTIIGLDTETTGLLAPSLAPLKFQPHMTEICILVFDESLNLIDAYDHLIKPPIPIPEHITRITTINDYMVKKKKPFKKHFKKIKKIIESSSLCFGQNMMFDYGVIEAETKRLGKKISWPPLYCTIENSMHLKGIRLKNSELYELVTGKPFLKSHRARPDIEATFEVFKHLWRNNNVS